MSSLIEAAYLNADYDTPTRLESAGTSLENPFVYDSAARDLKALATRGLVEITHECSEQTGGIGQTPLISKIASRRLR